MEALCLALWKKRVWCGAIKSGYFSQYRKRGREVGVRGGSKGYGNRNRDGNQDGDMGLRLWERGAGGRKELQLGVGQRGMMGTSSHVVL